MKFSPSELTPGQLSRLLAIAPKISPYDERVSRVKTNPFSNKKAAVLMPLVADRDEWHLLFTLRTSGVETHKNQVSFPGGTMDQDDPDLVSTALREVQEEIGVNPKEITVLGQLLERELVSGFQVTPVVGILPWPYPLKVSSIEVARVFLVPLTWLADETHHYFKEQIFNEELYRVLYFHPYKGQILWGASAIMTLEFLNVLKTLD